MSAFQLTTALESIAGLAVLSILVFALVPAYRLDAFRQRMFAERDSLWDYAASGKIAFTDPAYQLLRKLMNGLIRYGHQLTFFRALMTTLRWHLMGQALDLTWHKKWSKALSQVRDPEVNLYLETAHRRVMMIMLKHLILGSPTLLFLVMPVVSLWIMAHTGWISLRQLAKKSGLKSVGWVIDPALLEESAVGYAPRSSFAVRN